MRILFISLMCCALWILPNCSSVKVNTDYDHTVNFSDFKTFNWIPKSESDSSRRNSLVDRRIRRAIEGELSAKGYSRAPRPDFLIIFHSGAREKVDVSTWGYYGRRPWAHRHVAVHQYTEGTILIDIVEAGSKELIWRGRGDRTLTNSRDPQKIDESIHGTVAEILAEFPPS